jgi:hypothetical protein
MNRAILEFKMPCSICKQYGHNKRSCKNHVSILSKCSTCESKSILPKCSICKQEGHNKRSCKMTPKIHIETDINVESVRIEMNVKRNEVQSHGFSWEKELSTNVYGATQEELKDIKYTSKMDLPSELNHLDNCDVSMKTTCNENAVCMADCLRVYDAVSSGNPIHLVVIVYKQDDATNTKKISSIIEVDLTNSRELIFGTLTRSQLEDLDKAVKSIPQKRKPTDEEYKNIYSIRNKLQENSSAIHLDIKCNSTQSRLQCSFNHFQTFIEKNESRVIAKSNTNEFRGGVISCEINSPRRVFKKKQNV